MNFITDSYIEIGNSHNICEDYALDGIINNEMPYIIVSDGCSSSEMTDVGSRIMAHSCQKAIFERYRNIKDLVNLLGGDTSTLGVHLRNEIYIKTKHIAMSVLDQLGLPYSVCDATLLYAFIYDGRLYVNGYGDGNIVLSYKTPDGSVNNYWTRLSYESNAPFYISYDMDLIRKKSYMNDERFGGKQFKIDKYLINSTEPGVPLEEQTEKADNWYNLETGTAIIQSLQSITLASDGMESFSHSHKRLCADPAPSSQEVESLKPYSMMRRMVAYKNHNGEFVKRRMKRLKQEVEKIQGEHYDDVSSATIWVNHGE